MLIQLSYGGGFNVGFATMYNGSGIVGQSVARVRHLLNL